MGVIELLGGGGALFIALWLWRLRKITGIIRTVALSFGLIGALSVAGILTVEIHPEAAFSVGESVLEVAGDLWGMLLG